jgi:hypothetical protein
MKIEHKVQIKFNQHVSKYKTYFKLPVYKFIKQMMFGILTTGNVHLNKIGCILNERITLKKTTERLSRNLRRKGLGDQLQKAHLKANKYAINQCKYLIFDLSDISKTYAGQMEGMEKVHDGSTDGYGNGYWLSNIIAANKKADTILPVYSELYALQHTSEQEHSENAKILKAFDCVEEELGRRLIGVYDRGGDRRMLIEDHLAKKRYFIIRQSGTRHLIYNDTVLPLKTISKKVKLNRDITVTKNRNGKLKQYTYYCGAVPVIFPTTNNRFDDITLWLVVAKRDGRGYVWYLSHLPVDSADEAIETTLEGYGNRWKIEEVHRHIKQAYSLEDIQLRNYQSLKNFMTLFWLTMTLIYKEYESISLELIAASGMKMTYKNKLYEYMGFIYYKISKVISWLLSKVKLVLKTHYARDPVINPGQLSLELI